jgi:hypothetical protein
MLVGKHSAVHVKLNFVQRIQENRNRAGPSATNWAGRAALAVRRGACGRGCAHAVRDLSFAWIAIGPALVSLQFVQGEFRNGCKGIDR